MLCCIKISIFLIELNTLDILGLIVQPKGPHFRKYAAKCVKRITNDAYDLLTTKLIYNPKMLVTFPINSNAETPTYEIQDMILKQLSKEKRWTTEIIKATESIQTEINFQSHSDGCNSSREQANSDSCKRKFVERLKTNLYVIVVESAADFVAKYITPLAASQNFDSKALAMVLVTKIPSNLNREAKRIITRLTKGMILLPKNLTHFVLYKLNYEHEKGISCYADRIFQITPWRECVKGTFTVQSGNVFKEAEAEYFNYCKMYVQARKYPPYVIDKENGIENDIIKVVGKALNIDFAVQLHPDVRNDLGTPLTINDQAVAFPGFLEHVFNPNNLSFAIGNLYPDLNYTQYFTYSVTYHSERLAWAMPRANLIPSWRVLTVIFDLQMWGVCLTVIFGFGILFYITSLFNREVVCFSSFQKCLTASYEIILAAPVPIQPVSDFTRMLFISATFSAIIISSVYTSSLIQYLTSPVRERQITDTRTWISDPRRFVGGPKSFKTLPKKGSFLRKAFQEKFITANNDTVDWYTYWLNQVANKRNISSIIGRLPVKYLEAINDPLVTYRNGETKIYMQNRDMLIRSVSIMMKRGHPLKARLNDVLQKGVIEGGLIKGFIDKYMRRAFATKEKKQSEFDNLEDEVETHNKALTTQHLEGAFGLLMLGQVSGLIVFLLEVIYYRIQMAFYQYEIRRGKLFEFIN